MDLDVGDSGQVRIMHILVLPRPMLSTWRGSQRVPTAVMLHPLLNLPNQKAVHLDLALELLLSYLEACSLFIHGVLWPTGTALDRCSYLRHRHTTHYDTSCSKDQSYASFQRRESLRAIQRARHPSSKCQPVPSGPGC